MHTTVCILADEKASEERKVSFFAHPHSEWNTVKEFVDRSHPTIYMWRLFFGAGRRCHAVAAVAATMGLYGEGAPLSCESSSGVSSSSSKDASQPPPPQPMPNFRKRRLSVVSPNNVASGPSDNVPGADKESPEGGKSPLQTRRACAIEISDTPHAVQEKKASLSSMFPFRIRGAGTDVLGNSKNPVKELPNKGQMQVQLPFSGKQVAVFSAHGIEPHSYIVEEEPGLFFSRRTTSKLLTMATQKINQDRGMVAYPYGCCDSNRRTAFFAVHDGHGKRGEMVADFVMHQIEGRLRGHKDFDTNLDKALRETFLEVDAAIENRSEMIPLYSGSTGCVAILRDDALTVSNVGDSRAVLARKKKLDAFQQKMQQISNSRKLLAYECIELSKDQNAACPLERNRITKAGGYVYQSPEPGMPVRVYLDQECMEMGLAMSRSFGDYHLKRAGVIAEPVITHHTVTDDDEFFIIASDGLWEFISSDEAVSIVGDCFSEGMCASEACSRLIQAAIETWKEYEGDYRDDVTCVVVKLSGLWKEEDSQRSGKEETHSHSHQ